MRIEFKYRLRLVARSDDVAPRPPRPQENVVENTNTYVKYTSHCAFCKQSFPSIFELIRHLTIHIKDNNVTLEEFSACHSMRKACDECLDLEHKPKLIGEVYFERNVKCTICDKKNRRLNLYPKYAKKKTIRKTETVIDLCDDEPEQVGSRVEQADSDKHLSRLLLEASNSDMEMLIPYNTLQKSVSKFTETRVDCDKLKDQLKKGSRRSPKEKAEVSRPKKSRKKPKRLNSKKAKHDENKTRQVHCAFCMSTFKSKADLITHLTVHAEERRIPPEVSIVQKVHEACRKCSTEMPHRIIGELRCDALCSMCGQLYDRLILHRDETELNNLSSTEQNDLEVQESSESQADGTKTLALNGQPVYCAFCKLTFKYISELIDHLAIHVSEGKVEPVELDGKDSQMVYMACKSCYELMATPPNLMGELTWEARCSLCSNLSSHFHLYRQKTNQQKPTIIDLCEDELDDNVQDQGDSRDVGAFEGAGTPNSFRSQSSTSTTQDSTDSSRDQAESRNPILLSLLDGPQTDRNDPNSKRKAKPKRTVIHCALCDEKFNRVIELSRHMSTHAREGKMALQKELASEGVYITCERCHEMERMSPTELGSIGSEYRCSSCRKLQPDTDFDIEIPQTSVVTGKSNSVQENFGFGIDKWVQEQANASSSREYSYSDLGSLVSDSENASLTRLGADPLNTGQEHVGSTIHTKWGQIDFDAEIAALQVQASSNINSIAGLINNAPWNQNISQARANPSNEIVTLRKIAPAVDVSQSFINSYINTVWEHPNSNQESGAFISVPLNSGKQSGTIFSEPTDSFVISDSESADPNWKVPRWSQRGRGLGGPRSRGRSRGRPPSRGRGRSPGRGSARLPRLLPRAKRGKILSIKERFAFEDDFLTTSRPEDDNRWREYSYTRGKKTNAMRLINIQKRLKELKRY